MYIIVGFCSVLTFEAVLLLEMLTKMVSYKDKKKIFTSQF